MYKSYSWGGINSKVEMSVELEALTESGAAFEV